jgi:hypothetical protein
VNWKSAKRGGDGLKFGPQTNALKNLGKTDSLGELAKVSFAIPVEFHDIKNAERPFTAMTIVLEVSDSKLRIELRDEDGLISFFFRTPLHPI